MDTKYLREDERGWLQPHRSDFIPHPASTHDQLRLALSRLIECRKQVEAAGVSGRTLSEKALYYANFAAGETKGSRMVEIFRAAMIDALASLSPAPGEDEAVCHCGQPESAHCIGGGAEHDFCPN